MEFVKKNIGGIVLGGHVQALGITRILGRLGIPVIIIDNTNKNITRHSKYCKANFVVKDDGLLNFLNSLGNSLEYNGWHIYPTNDYHVKILSQNKFQLSKYFKVTTDNWDVIEIFYNKKMTYRLATKLNIPIAETYYPANELDLNNISPVFPCIIKPAVMHDFYNKAKKKVFICNNHVQLIQNYKRACKLIPAEEVIVQNIITGPSRNQFSACFLFLNGQSFVSLTATRMRQHPIDFGNATTYAEAVDLPILKEYAEKILRAANYNGLCEVEFKKDESDGQYKFLEVNTRTWKWHAIAEKTGTPFLESYYHYMNGESISSVHSQLNASFRHSLTDIPVQMKLLVKGYSYALRKKNPLVNAVWDWADIKPWVFEKFLLLHFIKNR